MILLVFTGADCNKWLQNYKTKNEQVQRRAEGGLNFGYFEIT